MAADRKHNLFERLRSQQTVAGLATTSDDLLICPLCWTAKNESMFSLEHIVPAAVGGRATTLTCVTCNNEHGRILDMHLAVHQNLTDVFSGTSSMRGKLRVSDQEVAVNFHRGSGGSGLHFEIVGNASDPKKVAMIREHLESGNVDPFTFSFRSFDENRMKTSLLRTAYLAMFRKYGYRYIAGPLAQIVRRRILDSGATAFHLGSFIASLRFARVPIDRSFFFITGTFFDMPVELVVIRCRRETTDYFLVTLPGLGLDNADFFNEFATFSQAYKAFRFRIVRPDDASESLEHGTE